uniref:Uncharacterized protein n=1 Tax=Aegilops tauschii subsp. strangulata TaxID=200361 RepID=A0A453NA97_AEGTS
MVARGSGAEEAPPPTQQRLVFAYYITGHGFGHATRALERAGGEAPDRRGARRARGHRRAGVRLHHRDRLPQPPHPQGPARLRRRAGRRAHRRPPRLPREVPSDGRGAPRGDTQD